MTLILETGSGSRLSNSYVLPAYVTAYLTERNRDTENSWSTLSTAQMEAACIAATDYLDSRWGALLKGVRAVTYSAFYAQARLDFSGNPSDSDTITLGEVQYTYVSTLNKFANNEILIGATAADTVANTILAVNGADATVHSEALFANIAASASADPDSTTNVILTARAPGISGNSNTLAKSSATITIGSGFVNGQDGGSQAREFPRAYLYDRSGNPVLGIPEAVKQAASEYAVRAAAAALWFDPTVDATGRLVVEKSEKVGPIEESTRYEEGIGLSALIKPYPAADRLLSAYLRPSGTLTR